MNQKLLIIFILVLLIVLVSCLILNKKPSDSFHVGNCDDLSTNVCDTHFKDTCRIHKKGTAEAACKYKCKFNPEDVFDTPEKHSDFGMVTRQVDDKTVYEFPEEDGGAGAYGSCLSKCREIQEQNVADENSISFCTTEECKVNCRNYVLKKVEENERVDIRYNNYPTDKISEEKYEEIKDTIISNMASPEYRDAIRESIYGGEIERQMTEQVDFQKKTKDLQDTLNLIKGLETTGNSFIAQIDQMGSFQDKYSNKIDRLLQEKRESNTALDRKLLAMSSKIEMLKKLYSDFDSTDSQDIDTTFSSYYKTATSLSNGARIHFTPVKYNIGTDANPSFKFFKNGAYLINNGRDAANIDKFLFLEPLKNDSGGNEIFCNPNDLECSYKLTTGTNRDADETISEVSSNFNVVSQLYPAQSSGNQSDFKHKKHAYFNIIEIKNNDQYNSIILKTPNGSTNLVKPNDIIKYPFFVIESIELPGFLINIVSNEDSTKNIKLLAASKKGSEKFMVDNLATTSTDSRCASTGGGGP